MAIQVLVGKRTVSFSALETNKLVVGSDILL